MSPATVDLLAWLAAAAGAAAAVLGTVRSHRLLPSLAVGLELVLAAGIMRLATGVTVRDVTVVVVLLGVRQLVTAALARGRGPAGTPA